VPWCDANLQIIYECYELRILREDYFMSMNIFLNNSLKVIAIIIGVLIIVVLLTQITGYKLNFRFLTFNREECLVQMDKIPDDQLGRLGREDKLNGWQKICSKPSLFIKK